MFAPRNIRNPSLEPVGPVTYVKGRHPDAPPCSCTACAQQYRTTAEQLKAMYSYDTGISDVDANTICTRLISSINSNRAFLQQQLNLRGSGITKRWKKRSVKGREDLLKSIDPDMYEKKWHEPNILYDGRHRGWHPEARDKQNIHLLPYMSVENLKEDPSRLIKLLQLRTKYSPADLATTDNHRLTYGWTTGIFKTIFNGCAVIMHGTHYGELTAWVSDEVHRGDSVGFPRAQLILKAQSQLLSVLRGIVEVLVDGLPEDIASTTSANVSLLSYPAIGKGSVYVDEAFSQLHRFDLDKLAEISNNRLRSATDHLSHLQTDPAYMRRYVEVIQASGYSELTEECKFIMTTHDLDYEAWTIRHWSWISDEISELKQIQNIFVDQIHRGQRLPPKYRDKLAALEALILKLLDIQCRHIQSVYPYRPGFQRHYKFNNEYTTDGKAYISHAPKCRSDDPQQQFLANAEAFKVDPMHWCLISLTTHPDAPGVLDKFRLLEFWDQHLDKASAEECARLDETLLRKVSDLAAFNELLMLVRSHRPCAPQQDMVGISATDRSLAWRFMGKTITKAEIDLNGKSISAERTIQEIPLDYPTLGQQLKTFMSQELPQDNASWLAKEDAQRRALRHFWYTFRQESHKRLRNVGIGRADIREDLKLISADTDPAFLAALEAERKEILATIPPVSSLHKEAKPRPRKQGQHLQGVVEPSQAPTPVKNPRAQNNKKFDSIAEAQTEWGTTPVDAKPAGTTKAKVKTRGDVSAINQDLVALKITSSDDLQQETPPEKVLVKKSALGVFSSLFVKRGKAKGVLWDRFVDAMAKVGFMSRHSGGSAVTFEPDRGSKWYGLGSIVFHRPHPDSTIDHVMLTSIGKRMNKWFGWDKDTFELDK